MTAKEKLARWRAAHPETVEFEGETFIPTDININLGTGQEVVTWGNLRLLEEQVRVTDEKEKATRVV